MTIFYNFGEKSGGPFGVNASGIMNEFKIPAEFFADLEKHNRNCTTLLDDSNAILWCEDGYFTITGQDEFIGSRFGKTTPTYRVEYDKAPNDIRLGSLLSVVENRGDRIRVIKF